VTLDTEQGQLTISVDKLSQTHRLRAFTWLNPRQILDWNKLSSIVMYGGTVELYLFCCFHILLAHLTVEQGSSDLEYRSHGASLNLNSSEEMF